MARPCKTITADNVFEASLYFEHLLHRRELTNDSGQHVEAMKAFEAVPRYTFNDEASVQKAVDALQLWVAHYAKHKWPAFLALQRQKKFKKRNRLVTIQLTPNAHLYLSLYAEKTKQNLSNAVESLAKAAYANA